MAKAMTVVPQPEPVRKRNLIMYESPNEYVSTHGVGQIAAVRWLDDEEQPRWYIVVIVGQTDDGYEVRWKDEVYRVNMLQDEAI